MAERNNAKKTKAGGSGVGCLMMLAMLLLLIGLILFNRETIIKAFKGNPIIEKILKNEDSSASKPAAPAAETPAKQAPEKNAPAVTVKTPPKESPPAVTPKPASEKNGEKTAERPTGKAVEKPAAKTAAEKPAPEKTAAEKPAPAAPREETVKPPAAKSPPVKAPETKQPAARERTLWFIRVDGDGAISRVKTRRSFTVTDNPLVDVLTALMAGPVNDEKKKGYSSLIPEDAKLLSATVRGSTAYLSFNEAFLFNSYGVEGSSAQLRQIVWTATEFESVKEVQILIEGRRVDYLGSEGIFIGNPLNRESF